MRVVIHDEETLEPITVVTLPGLTEKNLEQKRHWRVSVHDGANAPREMPAERAYSDRLRFVDLTFEKVSRVTLTYGEQVTWRCLTRATETAPRDRPAAARERAAGQPDDRIAYFALIFRAGDARPNQIERRAICARSYLRLALDAISWLNPHPESREE